MVDSFLRLLREAVGKENSREEIISIVKDLKFRIHDWEKFVHFSDSRYVRSLVATEQEFSVLLLCWAPGQSNAVHKHTQSSGDLPVTSYSRVLCGKLTLSLYAESDLSNPMQVLPLTPSDISFESSCHPLGYHRISNDSPCPAISIHIYSPPYISCLYPQSEDRTNFVPPVFHPSGGGAAEEQRSPNPNSAAHINSALVNPLFGSLNDLIDILRSAIELTPDGRAHSSTNVEHVKRILTNFSLDPQEWHSYVSKSKQKYTRNIIAFEPKFTILLLVWDKNQFSPIHDHASSNCWVKLLSGLLQEVRYSATGYDLAQGEAADATRVTPLSSNVYSPGAVTYINDQQGLHKMGNPSGSAITCSLHIYSPPYRECNIFKSLTPMPAISPCGSAVDAAEAEGASTTGQVRAYECNKEKVCISAIYGKEHTFMLHPAQQAPDEAPKTQLDCSGNACQSSSLEVLQDLLRRAFAEHPREKVSPVIHDILKGIQFCAAEWRQYVHFNPQRYSRNLLLFDEHFSLLLNCWAPGQGTPVHDHGSENRVSWVRVLGGALRFTEFDDEGQVQREITYLERSSNDSFVDTSALPHKLENVSEQDTAISIHLYSPPFLHCRYIDTEGSHRLIPAAFCSSAVAPSACSPRLSIERLRFALETQEAVFTNLRSFCQVVSDLLFSAFFGKSVQEGTILRAAGATNAVILKALRTVQFLSLIHI